MANRLLSELRFASLLVYHPRSQSRLAATSREVCFDLKDDRNRMVERVVGFLDSEAELRQHFHGFLNRETVLVPVPRSAPLVHPSAHWPARRIAEELVRHAFGSAVRCWLERSAPVSAAHLATPGQRPGATEHYESFRVQPDLDRPQQITIVDDVITQGNTAFGAARRLAETFPEARIRAFGVVRTMGLVADIEKIIEPATGKLVVGADGRIERVP